MTDKQMKKPKIIKFVDYGGLKSFYPADKMDAWLREKLDGIKDIILDQGSYSQFNSNNLRTVWVKPLELALRQHFEEEK